MCNLFGDYEVDDDCGSLGSISRVLVITRDNWVTSNQTMGTGVTREQIATITGLPAASIYEIGIDVDGAENSYAFTPSDGTVTTYTQTLILTRNSLNLSNNQLAADLQTCCNLVFFVQLKTGSWFVFGVDRLLNTSTKCTPNGIRLKTTGTTGGTPDTSPTTTYTFAHLGPKSNTAFLTLSAAAETAVLAAIA